MKTRFVLTLLLSSVAGAQSPGTFTATGNMAASRVGHTATLLLDGRVLIAGGEDDTSILSSAEIYNPATGTFAPTGNLPVARYMHSATLLPDGRVLIAGGYNPLAISSGGFLTSAEIYDPSTGAFTLTGNMMAPGGPAVLLQNGKVFISAGFGPYGTTDQAELYDPSSGVFSAATAQPTPVSGEALATLLPDGRVLITGYTPLPGELYDPSTGIFSPTGNIDYEAATPLMNGTVLFIGDQDDEFHSDRKAWLYDPSAGAFTLAGNTVIAREAVPATLLPDGTVLIAGTELIGGGALASAEIYDSASGAFGLTGSMITARQSHKATLLNNGQVLITGGFDFFPSITSSAELYTPLALVPAPELFSLSGDGRGQGAIWHSTTGVAASPSSPANVGEILSMYTTSLPDDGVIPPQVAIGGRLARVLYFGASGYPGYNQVNFRVPCGVTPGSAVSIRLTYLARPSNEVTIGVQ